MTIGEQAQSPVRTGGRDGTYLNGIQILRFVAALAVVLAHIQHEIVKSGLFTNFRPFDLIDGGFGVDIFFVISGFIMLHVSKDKFGKSGASVDFIMRRFLRIAPLYYIATLLTLVAILLIDRASINNTITLIHVLGSFLFFPTQSYTGDVAPVLKLGWTLNFEFLFYAIFSLSMIFRLRAGLIFLTFALTAIVLIANCVPHPPAWLSFWGQSLVFEFLGGVLLAILYQSDKRLSVAQGFALVALGLGLVTALKGAGTFPYLPRALFAGMPAWLIVSGVILTGSPVPESGLVKFLLRGGEASYALYLFHPFIIKIGSKVILLNNLDISSIIFIVLIVFSVIVLSFIVNITIEKPMYRVIKEIILSKYM